MSVKCLRVAGSGLVGSFSIGGGVIEVNLGEFFIEIFLYYCNS